MENMLLSRWEVVLGAVDRVNIPCRINDTHLCQADIKMTKSQQVLTKRYKHKTCYVTTGASE